VKCVVDVFILRNEMGEYYSKSNVNLKGIHVQLTISKYPILGDGIRRPEGFTVLEASNET